MVGLRRPRAAIASLAVALALGGVACGGDGGSSAADESPAALGAADPTTTTPTNAATSVAPAPTTTTPPATTVAPPVVLEPAPTTTALLPTLPVPIDSPADVYAPEPEIVLGTISIPAIGLETTLYQGIRLTTLDRGPGHWPGTAMPGERGNVVVAGHRVTHSRPFRNIDQLVDGDVVLFTVDDVVWTYVVVGNEVVEPVTGMRIVTQTPEHTATLFACHPPGSARYRYVVHLQLQDPPPTPAGGGDPTPPRAAI